MPTLSNHSLAEACQKLSFDPSLRDRAIHDPKALVLDYFELTDQQKHALDEIPASHWREVSDHIADIRDGASGKFTYHVNSIPPDSHAEVSAGCSAKVEVGP